MRLLFLAPYVFAVPVFGAIPAPAEGVVQVSVYQEQNAEVPHEAAAVGFPGIIVTDGLSAAKTDAKGHATLAASGEEIVAIAPTGFRASKSNDGVIWLSVDARNADTQLAIAGGFGANSNTEVDWMRDTLVKSFLPPNRARVGALLVLGDVASNPDLYPRIERLLRLLPFQSYLTAGHIDRTGGGERNPLERFSTVWQRPYFAFEHAGVLVLVLDTSVWDCAPQVVRGGVCVHHFQGGLLGTQQLAWARAVLDVLPRGQPLVIASYASLSDVAEANPASKSEIQELIGSAKPCGSAADADCRPVMAVNGDDHVVRWRSPTSLIPFEELSIGAVSGNWWFGDYDMESVPDAWQRDGSPRGLMVLDVSHGFAARYLALGRPTWERLSLTFDRPAVEQWRTKLLDWRASNPDWNNLPPVNAFEMPDPGAVTGSELGQTSLFINAWDAKPDARVGVSIDGGQYIPAARAADRSDPFALRRQLYISRFALASAAPLAPIPKGFEAWKGERYFSASARPGPAWLDATSSTHLWQFAVPAQLKVGTHIFKVRAQDSSGGVRESQILLEVLKDGISAKY